MAKTRAIVSRALEARDKAGLKVRQPLKLLTIKENLSEELLEVIRDEVNVKGVSIGAIEGEVLLDTNLTPELKEEGFVRELVRAVQAARKEAGLNTGDAVSLHIDASREVQDVVTKFTKDISETTHSTVAFGTVEGARLKVGDHEVALSVTRA